MTTKDLVLEHLRCNLLSSELQWNLFVSAAFTYRHDTVLRPFPPNFVIEETNEKDIHNLRKVIQKIPPLADLLTSQCKISSIPNDCWKLLEWVLVEPNFNIKPVDKSLFEDLKRQTGQVLPVPEPTHIFQVTHSPHIEEKFLSASEGRQVMLGYHGSKFENFYSILHHGLVAHLNKNGLYGSGTYLSSDLSVSLPYSPLDKSWIKTSIGASIGCIAVCELLDIPDVKCQSKDGTSASRGYSSDTMGGSIPEKYFLVQNNEAVCLRYLLVYSCGKFPSPRRFSGWQTFVNDHKFVLFLVAYGLILIAVGISNSYPVKRFFHKYLVWT